MRTLIFVLPLLTFLVLSSAPAKGEPTIERFVIESLIRDQLNSWALEDEALFLSTVHPDIVFAYPGDRLDGKGALEIFRFWAENYSNTKVYFHKIIIENNYFSVEYQFATTRDKDGARSASGTVATGYVKDGKLLMWKEYLDGRVSRMQMTGELPVDEGAEPYPWPSEP